MSMQLGIDVIQRDEFRPLTGKRVGLFTNPSGVDRHLRSTYHVLSDAVNVELVALFAPEHGVYGAQADSETVNTSVDARTQLPIYSLYGETFKPTPAMLADIDVFVCDIQDIGVRYYTYISTLSYILEAAGEQQVEVMILDRPNPFGGQRVAGPMLDSVFSTFVGRFPMPVLHGLTLGELARMINDLWNPAPAELNIILCEEWEREFNWNQTSLMWVSPSPNMPHLSTLWHYPGACLIEGTNLSEGRGTALPFEIVGAPWIDADSLADHLNRQGWSGVIFRPHNFQPTASKHANQICYGVQVHMLDDSQWRALPVWLGIVIEIHKLYPDEFKWLPPFREGSLYHFDRLIGSDQTRLQIEAGEALASITKAWPDDCATFIEQRQPYLLYT